MKPAGHSLHSKSGMGVVKAASLIVPAVLLMVFVAVHFYQEGDGAFEAVASRIVPWPSMVVDGETGKLDPSASASVLTSVKAEENLSFGETDSILVEAPKESIEQNGTVAVASLLPRNMLNLGNIASVLSSAESLTLEEPTPEPATSSAQEFIAVTTEHSNSSTVPDLVLANGTVANLSLVANLSNESGSVNGAKVEIKTNNTDLIFEPSGNWERNSNGQGFSFMGSPNGRAGTPEAINFNTSLAHEMLNGKWIYFWGDSTMRQIFTSFLNGIQGSSISFQVSNFRR